MGTFRFQMVHEDEEAIGIRIRFGCPWIGYQSRSPRHKDYTKTIQTLMRFIHVSSRCPKSAPISEYLYVLYSQRMCGLHFHLFRNSYPLQRYPIITPRSRLTALYLGPRGQRASPLPFLPVPEVFELFCDSLRYLCSSKAATRA